MRPPHYNGICTHCRREAPSCECKDIPDRPFDFYSDRMEFEKLVREVARYKRAMDWALQHLSAADQFIVNTILSGRPSGLQSEATLGDEHDKTI